MSDAIVMNNVRKTFGKKVAVEGIDLRIPEGSLYGFIGPNGAGKTTSIRMIMSIIFPDSGELSVLGKKSAVESKDRIGYLPEERGVYKKMKVGAFLRHIGKLKNADPAKLSHTVNAWLDRVGLIDVANKRCEELSKGMQQKVQFIAAVLHEPDLIILDEPFSGLDPVNMRLLRDLIDEQNEQGRTVIFSTHVMSQAEQICDHIVMIHNGRKMMDDPMDTIRRRYEPKAVIFEPLEPEACVDAIGSLPNIASVSRIDGHWQAELATPGASDVVAAIARAMPMSKVELHRPTLEDVFIEIVSDGTTQDEEEQLRASLRAGAVATEEVES